MKHIPNILSVIRLLMIPLFVFSYFEYSDSPECYIAAGIYALAWLTDALDGYLARRFNWITDVGKILDPLADKLMQITAAVCFTVDNIIFLVLLIPIVIKEIAMMVGGILVIKRKKTVTQARWYGKLATVILFLCAFLRIIVRGNAVLDIIICAVMVAMLIFSFLMYYLKVYKER
ncbi:MAG: CDP-alcohol phosphatidyltransferase family protein [Clostridia bacterium]|nr:CDP-alcohol phosphatidyltransferase family protein [Clostridia bacterium]